MVDDVGEAALGASFLARVAADAPEDAAGAATAIPAADNMAPTGRLGLVWNIREERINWVAELSRIMHRRD